MTLSPSSSAELVLLSLYRKVLPLANVTLPDVRVSGGVFSVTVLPPNLKMVESGGSPGLWNSTNAAVIDGSSKCRMSVDGLNDTTSPSLSKDQLVAGISLLVSFLRDQILMIMSASTAALPAHSCTSGSRPRHGEPYAAGG